MKLYRHDSWVPTVVFNKISIFLNVIPGGGKRNFKFSLKIGLKSCGSVVKA